MPRSGSRRGSVRTDDPAPHQNVGRIESPQLQTEPTGLPLEANRTLRVALNGVAAECSTIRQVSLDHAKTITHGYIPLLDRAKNVSTPAFVRAHDSNKKYETSSGAGDLSIVLHDQIVPLRVDRAC
jgi:hypothetical protein